MSIPRISIARSAANDVALMLQLLPFSQEVAQLAANPRRFVQDHRGELRFLQQVAQGYGQRLRRSVVPAPDPAVPVAPVDAAIVTPAVAGVVGRRTTLLR